MMKFSSVVHDNLRLLWLLFAAFMTVVLWQMPFGNLVLYPFTILATWFHEMGHGLTAISLGGHFDKLLIFPNGSGLAYNSGRLMLGALGKALVSAGGLMGPAIAGMVLLLASRDLKSAKRALFALGILLIFSTLIWVRSWTGWLILPLLGTVILYLSIESIAWLQIFAVQFLGVQACISSYRQLGYLFSHSVTIGGRTMPSDTGRIAQLLGLPYWFWGALIAIISGLILVESLQAACKKTSNQPMSLPLSR